MYGDSVAGDIVQIVKDAMVEVKMKTKIDETESSILSAISSVNDEVKDARVDIKGEINVSEENIIREIGKSEEDVRNDVNAAKDAIIDKVEENGGGIIIDRGMEWEQI